MNVATVPKTVWHENTGKEKSEICWGQNIPRNIFIGKSEEEKPKNRLI